MKRFTRTLVGALLTGALSTVAIVGASAPAQAGTASRSISGFNPSECRHNAQEYQANWAFGYDAAIISPCRYDPRTQRWWATVRFTY